MFGAILKAANSSFQKGMTFCRSIYVKKVMKLLAFIFEQPSYHNIKMTPQLIPISARGYGDEPDVSFKRSSLSFETATEISLWITTHLKMASFFLKSLYLVLYK